MTPHGKKWFGVSPVFDPAVGETVVEPPGTGIGYWAGAPSAVYDDVTGSFFLYYRERKPLDQGRGWRCHVARSDDGVRFSVVWTATKEELNSESIERAALIKALDGRFHLYVSYVDLADRRWKIALIDADSPEQFDASASRVVMTGEDADAVGAKDPYVVVVGRHYYMFVHHAPRHLIPGDATEDELHGTGNVFATEKGKGGAGLAVSDDGVDFEWLGDVLLPGRQWDRKLVRVDTMVYSPPVFTVFYSGRGHVSETYEDRTGLATSFDLRTFHKLTDRAPALVSPHGTGTVKYTDALDMGDEILYYYQCARADGSHELRVSRVRRE